APVKLRRRTEVELEVEGMTAALEVLVQLPAHPVEGGGCAQDARAEVPGESLELGLGLRIEADAAKSALRDAHQQRADGRVVEDVERDVELSRRSRRGAETLVENGRDWGRNGGHRC